MSQINFSGVPAGVKATVPDMRVIAKEAEGIKPFPELCEEAGKRIEQKKPEYLSPYAIYESPAVADANKQLSSKVAEDAYKTSPIPYN